MWSKHVGNSAHQPACTQVGAKRIAGQGWRMHSIAQQAAKALSGAADGTYLLLQPSGQTDSTSLSLLAASSPRNEGSGAVKPSAQFDNKLISHRWLHLKKIRGGKKESCRSRRSPQMLPRSRALFCDLAPVF